MMQEKTDAIKQQKIEAANDKSMYTKDKRQWYANALEKSGLNHQKFTGDFGNMHGMNDKRSQYLIDLAVKKGDYAQAEKFNREWKANRTAIDKYWHHRRGKDDTYDLFKMPKGGGGSKKILYNIKDENGKTVDTVELTEGELRRKDRKKYLSENYNIPSNYVIAKATGEDQQTKKEEADTGKILSETKENQYKDLKDKANEEGGWFSSDEEDIKSYAKKRNLDVVYGEDGYPRLVDSESEKLKKAYALEKDPAKKKVLQDAYVKRRAYMASIK